MVPQARILSLLAVAFALTGCASAGQAWRAGPAGIPAERSLRAQMVAGQYGSALEALKDKRIAPSDALLRQMYRGLVAMHAGQSELGTRALDRAWEITDQRWTKRLSDGAASMVTGDGALPYYPGPAERMMIPYYGGLNWLARNERDEAAVEARRLSVLLASESGSMPGPQFQGAMRYVAGVLFEAAGERNDADVAYRNASVLLNGALPGDTLPSDDAHGDVVVLIEDGFVARPEPASTEFWVSGDEIDVLNGHDEARRLAAYETVNRRRSERHDGGSQTSYRSVSVRRPVMDAGAPDRGATLLRARAWRPDSLGGPIEANTIAMSVSDAVRADFERQQPGRISRAIARAALRDVELHAAGGAFKAAGEMIGDDDDKKDKDVKKDKDTKKGKGDKGSDDDGGSGMGWVIAGVILLGVALLAAHVGSQILDQPDLRAWQLLPDRVTIARVRLPVGDHPIEVMRDGELVSLGTVTVRPGSVTVLVHRWWPGQPVVAVMP